MNGDFQVWWDGQGQLYGGACRTRGRGVRIPGLLGFITDGNSELAVGELRIETLS